MQLPQTYYDLYFCSPDRVVRHFAFLQCFMVLLSVSFAWFVGPFGAASCTLWAVLIIVCALLNTHAETTESKAVEWTRLTLFFVCMLGPGVYFGGSNVVNRFRYSVHGEALLYDQAFLNMDEALLGWLFPRGQLSLFLDTNELIGVTTPIGIFMTEILQTFYASYYIWGNGMALYLAYEYWRSTVRGENTGYRKRMQWRRIQMFVTAFVGTFLFNFVLNMIFPAVSPRIYIANDYKNPVEGIFFANILRKAIASAAANSFSVFPSGHCGISWLTVFLVYRMGFRKYTKITALAATLIVTATLALRYHYFVDFLFAPTLIAFGAYFGGFHTAEDYAQNVSLRTGDDRDEAVQLSDKHIGSHQPSDAGSGGSGSDGGVGSVYASQRGRSNVQVLVDSAPSNTATSRLVAGSEFGGKLYEGASDPDDFTPDNHVSVVSNAGR